MMEIGYDDSVCIEVEDDTFGKAHSIYDSRSGLHDRCIISDRAGYHIRRCLSRG